jgi:hypothetical protein
MCADAAWVEVEATAAAAQADCGLHNVTVAVGQAELAVAWLPRRERRRRERKAEKVYRPCTVAQVWVGADGTEPTEGSGISISR